MSSAADASNCVLMWERVNTQLLNTIRKIVTKGETCHNYSLCAWSPFARSFQKSSASDAPESDCIWGQFEDMIYCAN